MREMRILFLAAAMAALPCWVEAAETPTPNELADALEAVMPPGEAEAEAEPPAACGPGQLLRESACVAVTPDPEDPPPAVGARRRDPAQDRARVGKARRGNCFREKGDCFRTGTHSCTTDPEAGKCAGGADIQCCPAGGVVYMTSQGPPGEGGAGANRGLACWDLNENGEFDTADEDADGDGAASVHDCRGAAGEHGQPGAAGEAGAAGRDGSAGSAAFGLDVGLGYWGSSSHPTAGGLVLIPSLHLREDWSLDVPLALGGGMTEAGLAYSAGVRLRFDVAYPLAQDEPLWVGPAVRLSGENRGLFSPRDLHIGAGGAVGLDLGPATISVEFVYGLGGNRFRFKGEPAWAVLVSF